MSTQDKGAQLLDLADAAEFLGVATRTVRRWIRAGDVDFITEPAQGGFRYYVEMTDRTLARARGASVGGFVAPFERIGQLTDEVSYLRDLVRTQEDTINELTKRLPD